MNQKDCKANYGLIGNSSVSQYAIKNGKKIDSQQTAKEIEGKMCAELASSFTRIKRVIPNITKLLRYRCCL